MSFRRVNAGQGIEWFREGVRRVLENPAIFLVNALIIFAISGFIGSVPLIGPIGSMLLLPVLTAGALLAFQEQHAGRTAQVEHLVAPFKEQKQWVSLLLLGLPMAAWVVIVGMLTLLFVGGALLGGLFAAAHESATSGWWAGLGIGALALFLLSLALGLVAGALVVFAVPRVFFDGLEPFSAMQESLQACLANLGALLIFALVFMAIYLVSLVLFAIPVLGWLALFVLGIALSAVSTGGIYSAYRDLFAPDAVPPPPAPTP